MAKKLYIIISVVLCSCIMGVIDGVIKPGYVTKSIFKLVLFVAIPLVYFIVKGKIKDFKRMFICEPKNLVFSLCLGIGVFLIVLGGYYLLSPYINFNDIASNLTSGQGVAAHNFIYVAIYISFINSLLEEFFFRGFSFLCIENVWGSKTAHIFSSVMFAIYHIGMTVGWFNMFLWLLCFAGLFAAGIIFNSLDSKSKSIYPSWIVHMFANFAINTIGFIMFGII